MWYRVLVQPTGLHNGHPWPDAGDECELEEVIGDSMVVAGWLERVAGKPKTEKRPAAKVGEETR